jgi:hypothetical protein
MLCINNISNISPFVLDVNNLSHALIKPIVAKKLIFVLNIVHIFHVVKVSRHETFTRTHEENAAIPKHFAMIIVMLDACFQKKIGALAHVIMTVIIVKYKSLCCEIHLFLSNSGTHMSHRVATC